jgi:uncharacterized protein (UPF0179 family)
MTVNEGNEKPRLDCSNLRVIQEQLSAEVLLAKKYLEYSNMCTDTNLKNLCIEASNAHKYNIEHLKSYLDSHQ